MARARGKAASSTAEEVLQAVTEALDDDEPDDLDEAELATEDFLSAFLTDADAKVGVYRVVEGQRRKAWLFNFSPVDTAHEEMMAVLRDEYGGGTFNVQVRRDGRIVRNTTVEVEAPAPKGSALPLTPAPASGDGTAPAGDSLASVVGQMSQMMMDGLDRIAGQTSNQFTMLLEVIKATSSQAPQVDPAAMQAQILEGVARMRELAGGGDSNIELFMRALEIGRDFNGPRSESSANDVLLEGLKQFAPLITAGGGGAVPELPAQVAPPAQALPAPDIASSPEASPAAQRVVQLARLLCQMAAESRDPELYADVAVDQLGPQTAAALFVDPASLDQIARLGVPEVVNFRPWFASMGECVSEIIQALEDERHAAKPPAPDGADTTLSDGDRAGARGDSPDATGDGADGGAGEGDAGGPPEGAGADGDPAL